MVKKFQKYELNNLSKSTYWKFYLHFWNPISLNINFITVLLFPNLLFFKFVFHVLCGGILQHLISKNETLILIFYFVWICMWNSLFVYTWAYMYICTYICTYILCNSRTIYNVKCQPIWKYVRYLYYMKCLPEISSSKSNNKNKINGCLHVSTHSCKQK